jgi:hypothetical protein
MSLNPKPLITDEPGVGGGATDGEGVAAAAAGVALADDAAVGMTNALWLTWAAGAAQPDATTAVTRTLIIRWLVTHAMLPAATTARLRQTTDPTSAKRALRESLEGPGMPGKFVLKKTTDGGYHFVLKARNGETIAQSETYRSKASAKKGIHSVRKNAKKAKLSDETGE